jgi:iron complex outermembrane recepter protein
MPSLTIKSRRPCLAWTKLSPLGRHLLACLSLAAAPSFALAAPEHSSLLDAWDTPVMQNEKDPGRLFDTPSSAFVLGDDALAYLPVDSVPELLRYAPGVHLMRASNGIWGLGIRGMNSSFLGRVLFTVDEQNIYSNLYAGLFGSQHDLLIDDVASIEVVYGPGGGLWSTNAVNGMVNVILKPAFETESNVLRAQVGSLNRAVAARGGWSVSPSVSARVFAKLGMREPSKSSLFDDRWESTRGGFQVDWRPGARDWVTFSGEVYTSELGYARFLGDLETGAMGVTVGQEEQWGVNGQARWTRQLDGGNALTVRSFLGYTGFSSPYVDFTLGVAGLDLRGRWTVGEHHHLVFKAGLNLELPELEDTRYSAFAPDADTSRARGTAALEYSFDFVPERWTVTAGATVHHESATDESDLLPSLRLIYRPGPSTRVWASFDRSARTVPPGMGDLERIQTNAFPIPPVPVPTPFGTFVVDRQFIFARRDENIRSETMDAYQIGFRHEWSKGLEVSLNAFHYRYDRVFGGIFSAVNPVLTVAEPYFRADVRVTNLARGEATGGELSLGAALGPRAHLRLNYAYLEDSFEPIVTATSPSAQASILGGTKRLANNAPRHIASLWWSNRWTERWRSDLGVRYTSEFGHSEGHQEAILQADARLSWEPREGLRCSLVGRNLLEKHTSERLLKDLLGLTTEQPREWYLEVRYEF